MIDLLIIQKQSLYYREQKLRMLQEQEDDEWDAMKGEINSSENEEEVEDYSWYVDSDPDTYFCLCTKFK